MAQDEPVPEMSHVTIDIPHCNKDDEELNTMLFQFFGEAFVNEPISIRTPGIPPVFDPPKKKRADDFEKSVGEKYKQLILDPQTKKALNHHYVMTRNNNQRIAIADINLKIDEYKALLGGNLEVLESNGFYKHANCLRVVNSYLSAILTDTLPDEFLEIDAAVSDVMYTTPKQRVGIGKLLTINKELFVFIQKYISHLTTDVNDKQMIDFYIEQLDTARHFFRDETYTQTSGVVFRSNEVTVPLLHWLTLEPGNDQFIRFAKPNGTNKISMGTARRGLPTTVYSSETIQVASLPVVHLFRGGQYDPAYLHSLYLDPRHHYQSGVGIYKNGSTGGLSSTTYKKIVSELNAGKDSIDPRCHPVVDHLIKNLEKVYFFHKRTDNLQEQKAKYLMSLLMFCSDMNMNDLLFSNQYARGTRKTNVILSYRNDNPVRIACWFVFNDHVHVVQLKICFQEFGKDLATILQSEPDRSIGQVLADVRQRDPVPSSAIHVLGKSLFSFGSREQLFPSIVKYGNPQVFTGGSASGSANEDFIQDVLEKARTHMVHNLKIIKGRKYEPTEKDKEVMGNTSSLIEKRLKDFLQAGIFTRQSIKAFKHNLLEDFMEFNESYYVYHFLPAIHLTVKLLKVHVTPRMKKNEGPVPEPVPGAAMNGSPPVPVPGADMNGSPPVPVPGAAMNGSPPVPVPGADMNGSPPVPVREPVPGAAMNGSPPVPVPGADMNGSPDAAPDCFEIILTKEWAMLMEILFLMDKLHDCAETRVKRMGFWEYVKEIHNSLIQRIKHKLVLLLTRIQPGFNPERPFPGPNPIPDGSKDQQFIFRFCVIVFDFFRTQFKSAKYEASIVNILIRSLKILDCETDIASESRLLKVIDELDCAVVNNAVMGALQTSHPYTYEGEAQPTNTVTICTPGGTYTDGGTVFDKRPVYIKPRNICVSYREDGRVKQYIKMVYKDYSATRDDKLRGMDDEELIEFFRDFLTVSIRDIETDVWGSYQVNPMRKVHNKTVLADELRNKFFSTETPHTDKKALCDFLQHFLPLAFVDCKVCFAVYQNDLMSVVFHMMTMIAVRESGETRTAMNCMKAVLYCPKRKLVFETAIQPVDAGGGGGAADDQAGPRYHLTCVIDCLDNKDDGEGENGDVDEMKDYGPMDVMGPGPLGGQMVGAGPTLTPNLRLKKVKSRASTHKAKRKRRLRTRKRQQGGAPAVPAKDPYPNTRAWADYETFCYMMDHLREPYTLYLSLKYRYHKQNGFTTLSITDYINGHEDDQTNPDNIEMEPYTFRDRAFLYYTFLDIWLDTGNEDFSSFDSSIADIENINQMIDGEFAFQSFLYNATIAMFREYNPVIENSSSRSNPDTKRMRVGTNTTRKLPPRNEGANTPENRRAENRGAENMEAIQQQIEAKKKTYKERAIDLGTEQKRLVAIVNNAIAVHTQAIAETAKKEVDTVIVLEDRLEEVEGGDDLKEAYRKSYDECLANAKTGIDEVVREAKTPDRVKKRKKQSASQDSKSQELSVMDTMISSYRLQESSKYYAERAWGNAMSGRYIKPVMIFVLIVRKRILDIQGVVVTELDLAIELLHQLDPDNLAVSLTGCEKHKKMIELLTDSVKQHVLQAVEDPPRVKENKKILKALLVQAMTIQSDVKTYIQKLKGHIKTKEEEMKRRATSKSPAERSRERSREKRSREQLPVPRGRSREKRPVPRGRGVTPLPPGQ